MFLKNIKVSLNKNYLMKSYSKNWNKWK